MLARVVTAPVSRICLVLATLTLAAPADAMPSPEWRGAERLVVLCTVDAARELRHAEIARSLCERIKRIVAPGSPVPVEIVDYGADALMSSGSVALLVHASVSPASTAVPGASGDILTFTMRTTPTGQPQAAPAWFGAGPRAVPFVRANASPDLDKSLTGSLAEILPWMRPAESNQLTRRRSN